MKQVQMKDPFDIFRQKLINLPDYFHKRNPKDKLTVYVKTVRDWIRDHDYSRWTSSEHFFPTNIYERTRVENAIKYLADSGELDLQISRKNGKFEFKKMVLTHNGQVYKPCGIKQKPNYEARQ